MSHSVVLIDSTNRLALWVLQHRAVHYAAQEVLALELSQQRSTMQCRVRRFKGVYKRRADCTAAGCMPLSNSNIVFN